MVLTPSLLDIFIVKESIAFSFDCIRAHTDLHSGFIFVQSGAIFITNDCTVLSTVQDFIHIFNRMLKFTAPYQGSRSFNNCSGHDLSVKILVFVEDLFLKFTNLVGYVVTIVDSLFKSTQLDEACGTIQPAGQELRVGFDRFGVGIDRACIVGPLKKVVTFVFQPHRVLVLNLNINVVWFFFQLF